MSSESGAYYVSFHQLQSAPLGMEAPLLKTPEAEWRASCLVGLLSETCEAGWRASSLVGSGSTGCGSPGSSVWPSPLCLVGVVGVCPMGRGVLLLAGDPAGRWPAEQGFRAASRPSGWPTGLGFTVSGSRIGLLGSQPARRIWPASRRASRMWPASC